MATPSKKKQNLPLKWYFQNPVCLTFCSVTRSIFHVGRKVRWVLKSSSPGLLKNGQKFFCMCSGTRENNKIGVQTVLLDTMYIPIYNYITSIQFYLATRTSTACTRATTRCSPAASPSTSSELPTTQQPRWQSKHVYCLSIDYAGKKLFLMFHVSVWMRKHQLSFLQLGHKHQK